MLKCIFCDVPNEAISIEHIIPESLGNIIYKMEKSAVCDVCNSTFSKFEDKALSNSIFAIERARLGIVTKKGKNVKGKIKNFLFEGDENFEKNKILINGIGAEDLKYFDSKTGNAQLFIKSFDKSEVSCSKLALKIALESIYTSRKEIFTKYSFQELKDYLTKKNNKDWFFLMTDFEPNKFMSVPKLKIKYDLKIKNYCELKILELDKDNLLFKFQFGSIAIMINLINRNIDWTKIYFQNDKLIQIYPKQFKKKIEFKFNKE
jgi:hypothetical protein